MASRMVLESALRKGSTMVVTERVTDTVLKKGFVGITQATKLLGIAHSQYVRRLVVGSKLDSIKVQLDSYVKWFVSKESIRAYLSTNRRTSTDRRYILRSALSNEKAIRKALTDAGITFSLELNYQGKVKS